MLTLAKCGFCKGTGTKVAEIAPSGGAYKQTAICCSSCNAILGVTGYYDAGQLLQNQKKDIADLHRELSQVRTQLRNIEQVLARR